MLEGFVTERISPRRMTVDEGCRKVMAGTGAVRYLTGNRKQVADPTQVTATDA